MKTEKIFYCRSRIFPVCYKVNAGEGIIESVKNWSEYPKSIDRFRYSAVLARELKAACKQIDASEYEVVREFVAKYLELNFPHMTFVRNDPKATDNQLPNSDQK